jgi:hypothetical protein
MANSLEGRWFRQLAQDEKQSRVEMRRLVVRPEWTRIYEGQLGSNASFCRLSLGPVMDAARVLPRFWMGGLTGGFHSSSNDRYRSAARE